MRIAITGKICSGKSFIANHIAKQINANVYSFGTGVKKYCKEIFNMEYKDRKLLQDLYTPTKIVYETQKDFKEEIAMTDAEWFDEEYERSEAEYKSNSVFQSFSFAYSRKQSVLLKSEYEKQNEELIKENKAKFTSQNETEITYAKKIEKIEAKINWREDAQNIIAKINALNPNPGCWFEIDGSRIKIIKAKKIICDGKPGIVLDEKFTIGCLKNAIQILEVKKEGKQKMATKEFLKGNKIKIGQNLN